MPTSSDQIDQLAQIAPGSRLSDLRQQRSEVKSYIAGSYDALFEPAEAFGLSRIERQLAALRVAAVIGNGALKQHHQARLRELGAGEPLIRAAEQAAAAPELTPRQRAIVGHAELLTRAPGAASQAAIAELRANGLAARDIVVLAQLVAFVNFQARLLAGLRLLAEEI